MGWKLKYQYCSTVHILYCLATSVLKLQKGQSSFTECYWKFLLWLKHCGPYANKRTGCVEYNSLCPILLLIFWCLFSVFSEDRRQTASSLSSCLFRQAGSILLYLTLLTPVSTKLLQKQTCRNACEFPGVSSRSWNQLLLWEQKCPLQKPPKQNRHFIAVI